MSAPSTSSDSSSRPDTDISLPAILCLHGYGTNAAILRFQLRHITQSLSHLGFRFIFLEGPFTVANPGPGALPTFADARPFRRWHADPTLASIFGVSNDTLRQERETVRQLIADTLSNEKQCEAGEAELGENGTKKAGPPGIVGIISFSQGAGLASAICLDKELGKAIKFVVCICALYPAVSLVDPENKAEGELKKIEIPSVHIFGKMDSWRGQSKKVLEQYYAQEDSEKVKVVELDMGHEVSGKAKDVATVVEAIREVWEAVGRSEESG